MTVTVMVPVAHAEAANKELLELGYGPCFSVPLSKGSPVAVTHMGCHSWDDSDFIEVIQTLNYPGLLMRHNPGKTVNFSHLAGELKLSWKHKTARLGGGS